MKATHTDLTKLISNPVQYYVPIFQRKYSWERKNCIKLLSDIIRVAKDESRPCHFIGSIIYLAKNDSQHASAIKEYLIIDGQQRLTTLSILLLALSDYTRKMITDKEEYSKAATNIDKINSIYLQNMHELGDLCYKIKLNEDDFYAYKRLLQNRNKPMILSTV